MKTARIAGVILVVAGLVTACGGRELSPEEQSVQQLIRPPSLLEASPSATTTSRDGAAAISQVEGRPSLEVGVPPDAGWAIVGRAMIRSGFAIVESDANAGTHLIRYSTAVDEGERAEGGSAGLFSRLAFWSGEDAPDTTVERFVLRVIERPVGERGLGSRVLVETEAGTLPPEPVARQILGVLAEQLRP